jgi:hypothetical protein
MDVKQQKEELVNKMIPSRPSFSVSADSRENGE